LIARGLGINVGRMLGRISKNKAKQRFYSKVIAVYTTVRLAKESLLKSLNPTY
jgi:hypothetical protein